MENHLSYEAMIATLKDVVAMAPADLEAIGVTQADAQLVFQETPWARGNIPRVIRTILTVSLGVMDLHGIPKATMPAEHLAAVIATLVAPANRIIACYWMAQERIQAASSMAYGSDRPNQIDAVTGDQLRGLVVLAASNEKTNFVRKQWAKKYDLAIEKESNKNA